MSLSEFGWLWKHQNNQACTVCKVLKLDTTQMKAFLVWPQDITWRLWQVIWCFTPSQPLWLYQGESLAKHSSSAYSTSFDIFVRASYLPTEQPMTSMSELLICPQNSLWHLCQSFLSANRTAYGIYVRASYLPTEQPMASMSELLICPQNSLWHLCQSCLSAHRTAYGIYVRTAYLPTEQPMASTSELLICQQNSLWHLRQSFLSAQRLSLIHIWRCRRTG